MNRRVFVAVLAVALALRLPRVAARWDEVGWLYAAYTAPTTEALARGDLATALTRFTGLHPPLYALLHSLFELALPVPLAWLAASALASLAAVALVARLDPLAGLVLATSAVQVHYAAEVNDYPLLAFWVALALGGSALAGVGAAWTHALGGVAAGLLALGHPRRWRLLGFMAAGALPLLPGVLDLAREPGTWRQPPFKPGLVLADLVARFGLLALLYTPALVRGLRRRPALGAAWLGTAAFVALMVGLGAAAPHQFPYLVALGPPGALLVAAGATGRLRWLVLGTALAQALWVGTGEGLRLHRLATPEHRAVDVALAEVERGWSCTGTPSPACSGDALYLLAPAGLNDDDKRRTSAVLWRLRPWRAMPMVYPYAFDYADHRHGQPRLVPLPGGPTIAVYVNDHVREELRLAAAAHARLWVVVYEQGRQAEFTTVLEALLGTRPEAVGADRLYRLGGGP